jgi:hypothetical protein
MLTWGLSRESQAITCDPGSGRVDAKLLGVSQSESFFAQESRQVERTMFMNEDLHNNVLRRSCFQLS